MFKRRLDAANRKGVSVGQDTEQTIRAPKTRIDRKSCRPLTPRQVEVCRAIMRLTEARGFAPTVRELASDLGIRSTAGITDHLRLLALKGAVTWVPMCSRTLRVLVPGDLL